MTTAIHRISDQDIPAILARLTAAGGTARTADTWSQDSMTALQLGEPADAHSPLMPLSIRTITVAPDRHANVGWISSNQFAQRISTRRQSRATTNQWPELLPELDALLVVRRDKPSLVGRWYAQTGFHDVLSIRCLYLDMDAPPLGPAGRFITRVAAVEDLSQWVGQMAHVHLEVFGHYGGPRIRNPYFWPRALRHHFYQKHYQFQIIGLWSEGPPSDLSPLKTQDSNLKTNPPLSPQSSALGTLMGYAVVGWSGWHSKRPRMDILELATRQWDTRVAEELIRTTCQLAWSKDVREVRAVVSVHDPYRSYLTKTGFEDRWGYVMQAKWLHAQRYLDRLAGTAELDDLSVQINAPGQVSLTLGKPGPTQAQTRLLRVQADEAAVTRLLFQRLDVPAAVREGQLLVTDGKTNDADANADIARLAMALPWTPWVFHMVDYI